MNPIACVLLFVSLGSSDSVDPYDLDRARARVVRAAVATVRPSIVTIETIGGAQPVRAAGPNGRVEETFRVAEGPTTGLVIREDGLILTSSFNFAREPTVITVTLPAGRKEVATLLASDHIRRLALLKVQAEDLPVPEWVGMDQLRVGQYAIGCGRGFGGTDPFASLGILSAVGRRNGNAVQTDAKTSPANYGGPLLDIQGRVIGIVVPMTGEGEVTAGAPWYDSGIGFAIGRSAIDRVLPQLEAGETIHQGKIGVVLEPDEPSLIPLLDKWLQPAKGVKIGQVADRSPASRGGLKKGDRIQALDGQPTGDINELKRRLSDRAAGETIVLTIKRRWKTKKVKIHLVKSADIGKALPEEIEGE